jgi:predicted dehydrogenase
MKALIAGLGSIGTRHALNLRGLEVGVVGFDPDAARREAFKARVPGAALVGRLDEGLAQGCSMAVIASPNRFHLEQCLAAADAGLHFLVEKPLATATDGIAELVARAERRRLVAMVGSNWKFHPALARMRGLLEAGEIGRALAVQAVGGQYLPDWHPWEDYRRMYSSRRELGGGALLDSHDVDYLTWLLGPVASVSCRTATTGTLDIDTEDLAAMTLAFRSGALGTLQLDYLQRPYSRRVHVTGESGTLVWDAVENELSHYVPREQAWRRWKPPVSYDLNRMYIEEMQHFLDCVRQGRAPLTPLAQGAHVMAVLDACRRSAARGGAPEAVAA